MASTPPRSGAPTLPSRTLAIGQALAGSEPLALLSRRMRESQDLSADRANAARRILEKSGVEGDRIYQVSGKGDREPLYPDDQDLPANRRISIVLLREAPVMPADNGL